MAYGPLKEDEEVLQLVVAYNPKMIFEQSTLTPPSAAPESPSYIRHVLCVGTSRRENAGHSFPNSHIAGIFPDRMNLGGACVSAARPLRGY
jgi:hypothetical protein